MSIVVRGEIDANGQLRLVDPPPLSGPRQVEVEIRDSADLPGDSNVSGSTSTTVLTSNSGPGRLGWQTRYRAIARLGVGGMGVAYKAEDVSGRLVCIKELHAGVTSRSLLQECRALTRLDHPRIVRLIDFDTLEDAPYLVLEYVDGVSLASIKPHLDMTVRMRDTTILASRIADALAFAHDQGVIHRDLKPGNVMLERPTKDLNPKILDFGLAVVAGRDHAGQLTAQGNVAGTLAYMAPEQQTGQRLSPACDIYALGQMMWELMAAQPAFNGSPYELVIQKQRARDGLLLEVDQCGNRDLADLIRRMTSKYPERRPTARAVIQELRASAGR